MIEIESEKERHFIAGIWLILRGKYELVNEKKKNENKMRKYKSDRCLYDLW